MYEMFHISGNKLDLNLKCAKYVWFKASYKKRHLVGFLMILKSARIDADETRWDIVAIYRHDNLKTVSPMTSCHLVSCLLISSQIAHRKNRCYIDKVNDG